MTRRFSIRRYVSRCLAWASHRVFPLDQRSLGSPVAPWQAPSIPDWVAEELRALAHIEPSLLKDDDDVSKFAYYSVPSDNATGAFYSAILARLSTRKYTHVFLIPWLKPGGADRGTLHTINGLREIDNRARVLIIGTEPSESPWKDRVPKGVDFIEVGNYAKGLDFSKQVDAVTRLMVQLQPAVIHIINSRVGWEMVARHGLALRQYSNLFASLFCDDMNPQGRPVGYARDYLVRTARQFTKIFCDNSVYPQIWSQELGVNIESFDVLPFPFDGEVKEKKGAISSVAAPRVLWAGRLDKQKRPDILIAIADALPEVSFDVHGQPVLDSGTDYLDQIQRRPNMTFHGPFADLGSVVGDDHIAYLMTTSWEGLPTILFDVAAAGLPICAPNVGGIRDFIPLESLIERPDDIDAFVSKLKSIIDDPSFGEEMRNSQYESLERDRTWDTFGARLSKIEGYSSNGWRPLESAVRE